MAWLELRDLGVTLPTGQVALSGVNWSVPEGSAGGIVGPSGSGKSVLAEAIHGKHRVTAGALHCPWRRIRRVAFREQSRRFDHANHYYQQRFNFIEPEDDLTLAQFLGADAGDPPALWERLGLVPLLGRSLIHLSNGQMRRARLARALGDRPDVLILDDPFLGIDTSGRQELDALLRQFHEEGQRLILITRPEEMPSWVGSVLRLPGGDAAGRDMAAPVAGGEVSGPPVIELKHVDVRYGEKLLLRDVSWTVRQGERWGLLGPNGSGKSTLLSLVAGDHPQAYSNDVTLFGRRRGTGESIWDVKRRIGFLSPELHLYFPSTLKAWEVVASGFFDVLIPRKLGPEQRARLDAALEGHGLTPLRERPFAHLATGQQRLLLFVRALLKQPELVILDEPFQGLDNATMRSLRDRLDRELTPSQTLLFVTHDLREMPGSVRRLLRFDAGRTREEELAR